MEFRVAGVREVQAAFARMAAESSAASRRIVKRGEAVVNSEIKHQFSAAHSRGTPTPAPPGAPPAVVTGTLRRSIRSDAPRSTGDGGWLGRVYPTVIYSRIQELGGVGGGGAVLPARPYVAPGYRAARPKLTEIARQEWGEVTRG